MNAIYRPQGRALEYSLLALNPWGKSWCAHGCTYCYVPGSLHMSREQWRGKAFRPVKDLMKRLRADCAELSGTDERVLLCFAGDMYSPEAAKSGLPRRILQVFRELDVPFQILTKGGTRAVADFDVYGPNDAFATTLTFWRLSEQKRYEPGAAPTVDRFNAIKTAKARGIETWVSLEPVLSPQESLDIIEGTHDVVDLYKIGKVNHDKAREAEIDWRRFGIEAVNLCEKYGVPYYVKDDLAKHLDGISYNSTDTRKVSRAQPIERNADT